MASVYEILQSVGFDGLGENTRAGQEIIGKQKSYATENIGLAATAAPAALAVSAQKNQGELAAQEASRKVSMELGNDPNDPNSLLSILVQDFRENTIAARDQAEQIAAKKQVGLMDDLPQFLINQITLPDDINAYNGTLGKVTAAKEGIAAMQSLTTAAAQAQQATKQTLTKDSIRQQAEVEAAQISQKINALKIDALGYDLEGIKLANHNDAQFVQYAMQKHSMELQDAAAMRAAEEHKWKLAQKKDAEKELDRYAQVVSAGAAAYELPAMGAEEIKARVKYGTSAEKSRLEKLYLKGMDAAVTGSKAIGSTPGEAIVNTLEIGGLKGNQNKPARDYLEQVTRQVVSGMNLTAADYKNPETKTKIAESVNSYLYGPVDLKTGKRNERMGELYKMASDVERAGSIYKAPELNAIINMPSVQTNPLFETVFKPAVQAGVTKSDPTSLYALGVEAVKRGVINDKQLALGLADFYKSVTAATYTSSGASKFNLPYRPSYVTRMENPMGFGDYQLDWTKESNWLMYHVSSQATKSFMSGMPTGATPGVR